MTAQPYPILEVSADLGGNVGPQTGIFEFKKATVSEQVRTGPLVESGLSQALSALSRVTEGESGGLSGITINNSAGQHIWQLQAESLGANDGQWGYTNDASVLNAGSATGGNRTQKAQVLLRYLEKASTDSFSPAKFKYGEYSPNGFMPENSIPVFVEDPENAVDRGQSSIFDIDMTLVQTLDLSETFTSTGRTG